MRVYPHTAQAFAEAIHKTQRSKVPNGEPYFLALGRTALTFAPLKVRGAGWIARRRRGDHLDVSNDLGTGHSDESDYVRLPVNHTCSRMKPPVVGCWMLEVFVKYPARSLVRMPSSCPVIDRLENGRIDPAENPFQDDMPIVVCPASQLGVEEPDQSSPL